MKSERRNNNDLIPKHGGYRNLKSFQVAQLVYDVTVRFCELYINKRSRTHDQMVQAARSGVQNIAEGSQASGTSKKMELKLTNVARASLEELKLDYEDFLRQRGLPEFEPEHPVLKRFKAKLCKTLGDVRVWVEEEKTMDSHGRTQNNTDTRTSKDSGKLSVSVGDSPCKSVHTSALVANAALSLLNLCCYFLNRQIVSLAEDFEKDGGFTERLYKVRTTRRKNQY
jgi:four helix bundle suffix protein